MLCDCVYVYNGYALLVMTLVMYALLLTCIDSCVPACLVSDVVCVSFSEANYSVPENGEMVEFVVVADKEFTFTFQVEVNIMPVTAQCKQFLCQMSGSVYWLWIFLCLAISHFAQAFSLPLSFTLPSCFFVLLLPTVLLFISLP